MSNSNIFSFSSSKSKIHPESNLIKSDFTYPKINSFDMVNITKPNSLVICDIDNTLLYWKKKSSELYYLVDELYPGCNNDEKERYANDFLNMYKNIYPPIHTDSEGFDILVKKIENMSSQLIFLTARQKINEKFTKKNLNSIGIDLNKYPIHYTDNFIETNKYSEIIFIDDYDSSILSVLNLFPTIICYKFEIE